MRYALLGDIHSSKEDLQAVLAQIASCADDAVLIGTGDLYECTVSKKDLHGQTYPAVEDVIKHPEGFDELLSFPSIYGNQEERIVLLTRPGENARDFLASLPEVLKAADATVIHGHQWPHGEGESWLCEHMPEANIVFHGHTHRSGLTVNGEAVRIDWNKVLPMEGDRNVVNVGAVVASREWVLFDAAKRTVMFMKAEKAKG